MVETLIRMTRNKLNILQGYSPAFPVYAPDVRQLCQRPYYGHPRGCPNWGKRDSCPPAAWNLYDVFLQDREFFIIWNRFDLGFHRERMKELHPKWTERQLLCCLYWQPRARKQLRHVVARFQKEHPTCFIQFCPEALGVNVTETMRRIGIKLEWPPITKAYQVAIAGACYTDWG